MVKRIWEKTGVSTYHTEFENRIYTHTDSIEPTEFSVVLNPISNDKAPCHVNLNLREELEDYVEYSSKGTRFLSYTLAGLIPHKCAFLIPQDLTLSNRSECWWGWIVIRVLMLILGNHTAGNTSNVHCTSTLTFLVCSSRHYFISVLFSAWNMLIIFWLCLLSPFFF